MIMTDETEAFEFVRQRQIAYKLAFSSPAGQNVLRDLIKFCRAKTTCFDADARVHAALEGRREVWNRIADHMNLTTEEIYELASGYTLSRAQDPLKEED